MRAVKLVVPAVLTLAYLTTKVLRWFPAVAIGVLTALLYDAFFTSSPLLDSWSEEGAASASTSWPHFLAWMLGAWLLFEGTAWPVFLYYQSVRFTATPAADPPPDGQRAAIYMAMIDSFATFEKVRAHPRGSDAAKLELRVRASCIKPPITTWMHA